MDYKWKQLILVVNFLFGLRVNEIPNNIGFSPALHLQCIPGDRAACLGKVDPIGHHSLCQLLLLLCVVVRKMIRSAH
jgi:hypothetical protein